MQNNAVDWSQFEKIDDRADVAPIDSAPVGAVDWSQFAKIESSGNRLTDAAVDLGNGVIGLGQSAVGLASAASGGSIGEGMRYLGYDPKRSNNILSDLYSDARKTEEEKINNASGVMDTLGALTSSPGAFAGKVIETAPGMLSLIGAARVFAAKAAMTTEATLLAKGMGAAESASHATKAAALAGTIAASVGEGLQQTGSSFDSLSSEGVGLGKAYAASLGSGAMTGLISLFSGRLGAKIGLGDVEGGVASKIPGGIAGKAAAGFLQEGPLEEGLQSSEETAWDNYAHDKPLDEGIGKAFATGSLIGGVAGAGFGAMNKDKNNAADPGNNMSDADLEAALSGTPGIDPVTGQPLAETGAQNEDQIDVSGNMPQPPPDQGGERPMADLVAEKLAQRTVPQGGALGVSGASNLAFDPTSVSTEPPIGEQYRPGAGRSMDFGAIIPNQMPEFAPKVRTERLLPDTESMGRMNLTPMQKPRSEMEFLPDTESMNAEPLPATVQQAKQVAAPLTIDYQSTKIPSAELTTSLGASPDSRYEGGIDYVKPSTMQERTGPFLPPGQQMQSVEYEAPKLDLLPKSGSPYKDERAAVAALKSRAKKGVDVAGYAPTKVKGGFVLRHNQPEAASQPVMQPEAQPVAEQAIQSPAAIAPAVNDIQGQSEPIAQNDPLDETPIQKALRISPTKEKYAGYLRKRFSKSDFDKQVPEFEQAWNNAHPEDLAASNAQEPKSAPQAGLPSAETPQATINTPKNASDIVETKSIDGRLVRVKQADIDSGRERLPLYTAGGERKHGAVIHRENLDPTGEKQAQINRDGESNPLFNVITTREGGAFRSRSAVVREINQRGIEKTHEVVDAKEVDQKASGFVIQKKQVGNVPMPEDAPQVSANTSASEANKAKEPAQDAMPKADAGKDPTDQISDAVAKMADAVTKLADKVDEIAKPKEVKAAAIKKQPAASKNTLPSANTGEIPSSLSISLKDEGGTKIDGINAKALVDDITRRIDAYEQLVRCIGA